MPVAGNVRTWAKERLDLARNVLNILRSTSSGRFQLEYGLDPFVDLSSGTISNLHDEFSTYADMNLSRRCEDALANLLGGGDERSRRLGTVDIRGIPSDSRM